MLEALGREAILHKLVDVEPCRYPDGEVMYYPCQVVLLDGVSLDPVVVGMDRANASDGVELLLDFEKELRETVASVIGPGHAVEDFPRAPAMDRRTVSFEDVADIAESSLRLPARFVEVIHAAGEVGMGLYAAQLFFRDGLACFYAFTHGQADFPDYPEGRSGKDVVDVIPLSAGALMRTEFSGGSTECYWMWL